ncbi:hypothetical protein D3C85_1524200 [compost metagenome]
MEPYDESVAFFFANRATLIEANAYTTSALQINAKLMSSTGENFSLNIKMLSTNVIDGPIY